VRHGLTHAWVTEACLSFGCLFYYNLSSAMPI
jgi:hypothetical protein